MPSSAESTPLRKPDPTDVGSVVSSERDVVHPIADIVSSWHRSRHSDNQSLQPPKEPQAVEYAIAPTGRDAIPLIVRAMMVGAMRVMAEQQPKYLKHPE